jgi:hypothetical protein
MTAAPRMVKLAELWQRKSAKGTVYFSGFMGDCQVLLFKEGKKPHPTKTDEEVIVWKLLIQERDQSRRPQQNREPNGNSRRGVVNAGETYAPALRDPAATDPGQRDTDDPGRPFDDEVPF